MKVHRRTSSKFAGNSDMLFAYLVLPSGKLATSQSPGFVPCMASLTAPDVIVVSADAGA